MKLNQMKPKTTKLLKINLIRKNKIFTLLLILLLCVIFGSVQSIHDFEASIVPPGKKGVILFDESHNALHTVSGDYNLVANMLVNEGYIVETLNSTETLTTAVLNEVDIMVAAGTRERFSGSEITDLRNWLQAGGSLFIISGESDAAWLTNDLMGDLFGFDVLGLEPWELLNDNDDYSGTNTHNIIFSGSNIHTHTITSGISTVETHFPYGLAIAPAEEIPLITTDTDGTATWDNGTVASGISVMSAFDSGIVGNGRMIFMGNAYLWANGDIDGDGTIDFYESDNQALALNSINWLMTNDPPTVSITYPNGGETLTGIETITWSASDPNGHSMYFNVSYWNSTNWVDLITEITQTSYSWDTSTLPNGTFYRVRVIVDDTRLSNVDESDGTFTVENPHPPTVTVLSPNGGEVLNELVNITWTATDPDGDLLTYDLYYWNATHWIELAIDLTTTLYEWNTSALPNGDYYLIKVTATDGIFFVEDTSDANFTVDNQSPPVITVLSPNGGEILKHMVNITWTATDPDGDLLTYDLYYWNATHWKELAIDLTTTLYEWNTSTLLNGDYYLIKVTATDGIFFVEDTSDANFTIDNPYPPKISHPSDFSIMYGEGASYSILWTITSDFPDNYTVYRNGTMYDQGSYTDSVIIWLDDISEVVGKHNFTCVVQTLTDDIASDLVWVTVFPATPDTTPPSISHPIDIEIEEGSLGYSLVWSGTDDRSPWWAKVWRDYTLIYDQAWIGNNISISLDGLAVGVYAFNCTLYDAAGNAVNDLVWVTVTERVPDTDPPTLIAPEPLTYYEGTTGNTVTWICHDEHPYAYKYFDFATGETVYRPWHGENITMNVDVDVENIIYPFKINYTLTLWDLQGNNASASVIVTILPVEPDTTVPTISSPVDEIIEVNTRTSIIWEVQDEYPGFYQLMRNKTIIQQGDWSSGLITWYVQEVEPVTYVYNLTLWDEAQNCVSDVVIIHIVSSESLDTSPPQIAPVSDQEIIFGSHGNSLVFYLFDAHPDRYSVTINSSILIESEWTVPNEEIHISLDGLAIGVYLVNLTAWDIFNYKNTREVQIKVIGDVIPPELSSPPDFELRFGSEVSIRWEASDKHPDTYQIVNLETNEVLDTGTWTNEQHIECALSTYAEGTYVFRCIVYDKIGNTAFDDVAVTVKKAQTSGAPGFNSISMLLIAFVLLKLISRKERGGIYND